MQYAHHNQQTMVKKVLKRLNNVPIRQKILWFNTIVLVATLSLLALLTANTLKADKEIGVQKLALQQLELVQNANYQFSQVRYWALDLSVSWLNESEDNMEASATGLRELLEQLKTSHPVVADSLLEGLTSYIEINLEAVDAYVDGNRVKGNFLLNNGRLNGTDMMKAFDTLSNETKLQLAQSGQRVVDNNARVMRYVIGGSVLILITSSLLSLLLARLIREPIAYAVTIAD
ncbi:MAG: hypothetical protein HRT35_18770, partial [Algicola sp.]|nr:hypothetical protein [Algicola sp.]